MPDNSLQSILKELRDAIANASDPETFVYPEHTKESKGGWIPCCPEDSPTGVMEDKGRALLKAISLAGRMRDIPKKVRDALKKLRKELQRPFWPPHPGTEEQDEWKEMLDDAIAALQPPLHPTHSSDFTSVTWFGTAYSFTKGLQAASVKVLWEAWVAGTPNLSQETIGNKAGSANERFRLEHVFRPTTKKKGKRESHPAWGTMIRSVGKGVFALSPP